MIDVRFSCQDARFGSSVAGVVQLESELAVSTKATLCRSNGWSASVRLMSSKSNISFYERGAPEIGEASSIKAARMIVSRLFAGLLIVLIAADKSPAAPVAPITDSSRLSTDYISAKKAYAAAFAKALGIANSPAYQLVAVNGLEWQVGDVVAIDDPTNILTYACRFENPPATTSWNDVPDVTHKNVPINFSLGLPTTAIRAFQKISAKTSFDFTSSLSGKYSISNLSGPIADEEDLQAALSKETCRREIKGPAIVVRGVIWGKETFSSSAPIKADATVYVLNGDVFTFRYDADRNYQLADTSSAPKFYVLTLYKPAYRANGSSSLSALHPYVVAKLESLNIDKPHY